MLCKDFDDSADYAAMLRDILGEDEDVVKVDDHLSFGKDGVHHHLKGGRAIAQAKQHHQGFKESSVSPEHSLVLISGLNTDIVIAPADIKLGEVAHAAELGDKRQRVFVLHHHCIQRAVVLYQPEGPILLFDEENWGCHGRLGGSNLTPSGKSVI